MKILVCAVAMIVLTACSQPAAPATPVLTGEAKLTREATAFMSKHADQYVKKCGEFFFASWRSVGSPATYLSQGKDLKVRWAPGYKPASVLTQADILNKVIPIPESWAGAVQLQFSVGREQWETAGPPRASGRTEWQDNYFFGYYLTFKDGAWSTNPEFLPVDCAVVEAAF